VAFPTTTTSIRTLNLVVASLVLVNRVATASTSPKGPASRLVRECGAVRNRCKGARVVFQRSSWEGNEMMRTTVVVLGVALLAVPASAQAQDIGHMLQGLTTGNQSQDQALHDAFERGYRAGQQDSARQADRNNRSRDDYNRSRDDYRSSDRDRDTDQSYQRGSSDR
jgi:hypothetical protein